MAFRLNTGRSQQWSNACSHNLLKKKDSKMRYTNLRKMVVTTCDVHKPPEYTTQEDRLND